MGHNAMEVTGCILRVGFSLDEDIVMFLAGPNVKSSSRKKLVTAIVVAPFPHCSCTVPRVNQDQITCQGLPELRNCDPSGIIRERRDLSRDPPPVVSAELC